MFPTGKLILFTPKSLENVQNNSFLVEKGKRYKWWGKKSPGHIWCLFGYLSSDKFLRFTGLPHPPLHFVIVYLFIYFGLVWFFRIWPVKRLKKTPRMWSKFLQYLLVQQFWFCKRFSDNLSFTTITAGLPSIQEKFHLKVRKTIKWSS